MTITERLFAQMKEKKITQAELASALGIAQPTIGHWKTRGTTPPMEYLPTICEVLGISWEYLVTGEETKQHLTADELHLVEQFRKVLPEGQREVFDFIEFKIYKQ